MFWTLVIMLLISWTLAVVFGGAESSKGMIHILLFGALIAILLQRLGRQEISR